MIWAWVKIAKYHELKDPRTNMTYDAWTGTVSVNASFTFSFHLYFTQDREEIRTLLISKMEPNKPAAIITRDKYGEHDMRFMSFEPETPPASVFQVPAACETRH